jgi:hypothetical protein
MLPLKSYITPLSHSYGSTWHDLSSATYYCAGYKAQGSSNARLEIIK